MLEFIKYFLIIKCNMQ